MMYGPAVVIADVIKMCGLFHYELFSNLERNKACIFAYDEKMQQVIGLMREREQTADRSQKKNRQNNVEL